MGFDEDHQGSGAANTSIEHMLDIVKQYTNQTFWFSASTVIALVVAYCIIIVLGLVGNILVIVVVSRKKVRPEFSFVLSNKVDYIDVILRENHSDEDDEDEKEVDVD